MARNYRPRPYQEQICQYCAITFETNHSRTKYCGDSCRVKAFYARQDVDKPLEATPVESDPSSSLKDIGTATVGATLAALLNYLVNDRPTQERIINLLESIKQGQTKVNLAPLEAALSYLVDYVGAQVEADPGLGPRMLQARKERLSGGAQAKQKKAQAEQMELVKFLNSLKGPS